MVTVIVIIIIIIIWGTPESSNYLLSAHTCSVLQYNTYQQVDFHEGLSNMLLTESSRIEPTIESVILLIILITSLSWVKKWHR